MHKPQEAEDVQPRQARRRYLAILFSDLSHSVSITSAMETEFYADLLHRLRRTFETVIPKHGGTIIELRGDGVLDRAPSGGVAGCSWPELDDWLGSGAQAAGMRRGRACGSSLRLASFSRLM
jgi:class 3 adenylate cyclase